MATSYKAKAIRDQLFDLVKVRLNSSLAMVKAFDPADLNPYFTVGTGVPGTANALIKVMSIEWPLAKDVLGLAQTVYTPHVISFVTEADGLADILTKAQLLPMIGQALAMGCQVRWYESANGDSPDLDDMTDAKLKATYDPDVYYPTISSQ